MLALRKGRRITSGDRFVKSDGRLNTKTRQEYSPILITIFPECEALSIYSSPLLASRATKPTPGNLWRFANRRLQLSGATAEPKKSATENDKEDDCGDTKTVHGPGRLVNDITQCGKTRYYQCGNYPNLEHTQSPFRVLVVDEHR